MLASRPDCNLSQSSRTNFVRFLKDLTRSSCCGSSVELCWRPEHHNAECYTVKHSTLIVILSFQHHNPQCLQSKEQDEDCEVKMNTQDGGVEYHEKNMHNLPA
jgi:hypothetical protein